MKTQPTCFLPAWRHRRAGLRQAGVTSIEYALLASLIAIAIVGALQATGTANGGLWGAWTAKFIAAVSGALRP